MTSPCEQLQASLDGTPSAEARAAFEAHLPGCAACTAEVEAWAKTGASLEAWAAPFAGPPTADALRTFRARIDQPERSFWPRLWVGGGALTAVALAVGVVVWRAAATPEPTEWPVEAQVEGQLRPVANLSALGSDDAALRVRIGPDDLDLARSARVEVVEKKRTRTRLKLIEGVLTAHIEPGHAGREFIIDSAPFRVTVVGTVFEVRRRSHAFHVATSSGLVKVERLSPAGELLESTMVAAGNEVELSELPEPADASVEAGAVDEEPVKPVTPGHLARGPSQRELLRWRARAARGECAAVIAETKVALAAAPSEVGTLRVQADCARKLGDVPAAVEAYRRVIASASGAEAAEAMLLAAALLQDELGDAQGVVDLTKTIRKTPAPVAGALHVRRARALKVLGRTPEALREVELTLSQFGSTPAAADALRLKTELGGR